MNDTASGAPKGPLIGFAVAIGASIVVICLLLFTPLGRMLDPNAKKPAKTEGSGPGNDKPATATTAYDTTRAPLPSGPQFAGGDAAPSDPNAIPPNMVLIDGRLVDRSVLPPPSVDGLVKGSANGDAPVATRAATLNGPAKPVTDQRIIAAYNTGRLGGAQAGAVQSGGMRNIRLFDTIKPAAQGDEDESPAPRSDLKIIKSDEQGQAEE
jgi:hypothetical protein